jgi:hypothetical protein
VRGVGHEPKNSHGRDGGGDATEEEDLVSVAVVETPPKKEILRARWCRDATEEGEED